MTAEEKKVRLEIVKAKAKRRAKARSIIRKRAKKIILERESDHRDRISHLREKEFSLQGKRRRKLSRRIMKRWEERQKKLQDSPLGSPRFLPCSQTTGDVHRARRKARQEAA